MTTTRSNRSIWLVAASITSVQVGSSVAKGAFDVLTPLGMAWLRFTMGALVLGLVRGVQQLSRRRRTRAELAAGRRPAALVPRDLRAGLAYAAALVVMNTTFYEALHRLPVGLAVTIEFLGPLTVGALGATRRRDLLWPVLALVGVALLGVRPTRPDPWGMVFILVAALCWGLYIGASERAGHSWNPVDALLFACTIGSVVTIGPALAANGLRLVHPDMLLVGLGVGALSTAVPYSLEMVALRSIPKRVFGVLMSVEPCVAALAALVLLGERLEPIDLVAMACVVVASIGATRAG